MLVALAAGFLTFFFSGSLILRLRWLRAAGGLGAFALVLVLWKSLVAPPKLSAESLQGILELINRQLGKGKAEHSIDPDQPRAVLYELASAHGLKPKEVEQAIKSEAVNSPDPYERGLAALYQQNYSLASTLLEQAAKASESEFKQDRQKIGERYSFWGQALDGAGRYRDAVAAYRRAVQMRGEHAETLNGLGIALFDSGDFAEAARQFNRALASASQPGTGELTRLAIQGNLAMTLSSLNDLGARRLEQEVLAARQRLLGPEHPDTLIAMNNLAETLRAQGEYPAARELEEQLLNVGRRVWGLEKPNTLTAEANLAETLRQQGQPADLARARELQQHVVAVGPRVWGPEHPQTLKQMGNLAAIMLAQKDLSAARKLQEQVVEVGTRVWGQEHPDTLEAMGNLASILRQQGDQKDLPRARELQERVFEARRRILGPHHPDTTVAAWNLLRTRRATRDEAGCRELEHELAWLSSAADSTLSAVQRTIRQNLASLETKSKSAGPARPTRG
ncbi:MAG TPA: tetratricopeptide repeat protein [Thermoanaerobaculia bacterium]|nr:tetratricopeptide repeat protein [Thermoanaerobaculia bacterium]